MLAAETVTDSPALLITQLGVGGVLVYFAAWAYRKIEESRDKLTEQNREDIEALALRHAAELSELRAELKLTRDQLIAALLQQNTTRKDPEP